MLNVLIYDNHPICRKGVVEVLKNDKNARFQIIDETGSKKELIRKISEVSYNAILCDISIIGIGIIELIQRIRSIKPDIKILLTGFSINNQLAIKALESGVLGYINKTCSPEELISAVIKVSNGSRHFPGHIAERLVNDLIDHREKLPHKKLTAREFQVTVLIGSGKKLSEIADELSLSPKTISVYRGRILSKLNLRTTADIVRYSIKEGLVD